MIAVYEEPELGLGIGLGALAGENDGYCVETVAEYDEAFRETLAVIEPLFKAAAIVGQYADRMAGRVTTMRTGRLTIRS